MSAAPIRRGFVIVSGAPGAGKSTLASPLAERLGLALIGKDHIKETLHDTLPEGPDRMLWSKYLGAASMELIWTLAGHAPAAVLSSEVTLEQLADFDRPIALGPVIEVDTTAAVNIEALADAVRLAFGVAGETAAAPAARTTAAET